MENERTESQIYMEEYRLTEKIKKEIYMGEGIKLVFPIALVLFLIVFK